MDFTKRVKRNSQIDNQCLDQKYTHNNKTFGSKYCNIMA